MNHLHVYSGCTLVLVLAACGGGTGSDAGADAGRDASGDTGIDMPSADASADTSVDMPSVDTGVDAPTVDTGTDASSCGNGVIDTGEACDGPDVGGMTCIGLGFSGGPLACLPTCMGYDFSMCTGAATCGDGMVDPGESCDGANLNGQDCASLGFGAGGALSCLSTCTGFNTHGCLSGAENCTNAVDDDGDGDIDCSDADCITGPECT